MTRPPRSGPEVDPGFPALKARIIARTGHHYYADKDDLLFDRLRKRFRALGVADSTAYAACLDDRLTGGPEWAALEAEITISETFFFRYAEQFAALRSTILPALLAARAAERTLRVWSAGCSTGAEPYSIAILLHELLGSALPEWRVSILGTDISTAALETARAGIYGRWALRTLPPGERLRYFVPGPAVAGPGRDGTYALRPEFRRMVRFERRNLMDLLDVRAAPPMAEFDLILCRNVLIYFETEIVLGIVRGLGRRLTREGWLLIGHAEPNPAIAAMLEPVNLPGTVAYRPRGAVPTVVSPAPWVPAPMPDPEPSPGPAFAPAIAVPVPAEVGPSGAGIPIEPEADGTPGDLERIRLLADAGETAEAWRAVRGAIQAAPTDPVLHYYEGLLAHSLGREAEAERAWRGALYLDRAFVMAHYQLGLLMIGLGRRSDAARALDNAIRLAQALAPDAVVAEGDGLGPHELARSAALARAGVTGEGP
ncbi:protein-glutamate methyltransferase [Methylobacterium sp. Leaf104]|uniref:CheR family methyltransferase n=1 Tax=Methylobacterium TaxID=407 RepID=UPI0006F716B7|nr:MULTISPECIES: protein-glutamate O-methyltransferase CheR [Methylobacterium]KQP40821.1 protein-glutamate methyltransferase [Methylobacterium sp. Leaf104]MCI9880991.1 protein-glutamate methyltransferase [Methylobacterium goesingense]